MKRFFSPTESLLMLRLCAVSCLVAAPMLYIYVRQRIASPIDPSLSPVPMIAWILLLVALIQIPLFPRIEQMIVKSYGRDKTTSMTVEQRAWSLLVVRIALPSSVFIYGAVVYFLTLRRTWLAVFYILATGLSILAWPTVDRYERLKKKLEDARRQ